MPFPVRIWLLVNPGEPIDCTPCGVDPVPVQVQVTGCPTATVSIAGLVVPLWPLSNLMLPTITEPTGPPPEPLPLPVPPVPGPVVLLEHPMAAAVKPARIQVRKIRMQPPQGDTAPRW